MDLWGRGVLWSGGASASRLRACSTVRCVSTSVSSTPGAGAGGGRGRGGLCATPPATGGAAARDTPSSFSGMRTYCGVAAAARAPCPASAVVVLAGWLSGTRAVAPAPRDFFSFRPENRKFANRERKPAMRLRGARAPASVMAVARSAAGARETSPPPSTTTTSASLASSLPVVVLSLVAVLALASRQLTSATTGENVTPLDPADTERAGGAPGGGATSCSDARSSSGVSRLGVARARNSGVDLTRASPERRGVDVKTGSLIGSGEGVRGGDGDGEDGSSRRRSSSSTSSQTPHESCSRLAVSTDSSRS